MRKGQPRLRLPWGGGARRLLAPRHPESGQAGSALALLAAACTGGLAVSMASSPLSGGPVAAAELAASERGASGVISAHTTEQIIA
jgi:hypothetical protein